MGFLIPVSAAIITSRDTSWAKQKRLTLRIDAEQRNAFLKKLIVEFSPTRAKTIGSVRKGGVIASKHKSPNPFTSKEAAASWGSTLIVTRVSNLYFSEAGFVGHFTQIQCELNRLEKIPDGTTGEICHEIIKQIEMIAHAIRKVTARAKELDFHFPEGDFIFKIPRTFGNQWIKL